MAKFETPITLPLGVLEQKDFGFPYLVDCLYFLFVISFKDGMMGLIEEFCYY